MDYEVFQNFINEHGEERLHELRQWRDEGKSYAWIGSVLHLSPSRVCKIAKRLLKNRVEFSDMTVLLLQHRYNVIEHEQRERRERVPPPKIFLFDASRDK